jgi:hypothetical protein
VSIAHSFLWRGKAYLLADRAITGADGTLLGTMSKFVRSVGSVPWAATYSGHQFEPREFVDRLAVRACDDLQSLAASMTAVLREMTAYRPDMVVGVQAGIWSRPHKAPVLFVLANSEIPFPGLAKAFEPVSVHHVVTGSHPPEHYLGRQIDLMDDRAFDPLSDGAAIIRAQRRVERFERAYQTPAYRIGGGIEAAIIGKRGVRLETLWVWPDRLGEKIDPAEEGFPFDMGDSRCLAMCASAS